MVPGVRLALQWLNGDVKLQAAALTTLVWLIVSIILRYRRKLLPFSNAIANGYCRRLKACPTFPRLDASCLLTSTFNTKPQLRDALSIHLIVNALILVRYLTYD